MILRALAVVAIALALAGCGQSDIPTEPTSAAAPPPTNAVYASAAEVIAAVAAAQSTVSLPDALAPSLAKGDEASPKGAFDCRGVDNPAQANPYGECAFGDPNGKKLMVIYGDSRSAMWSATLTGVAAKHGWKLRAYGLGGCPVVDLQFQSNQTNSPNTECDTYHQAAIKEITALKPELVVLTSVSNQKVVGGDYPTAEQWRDGWVSTFQKLQPVGAKLALIGDIPSWQNSDRTCLAAHMRDVQGCSSPVAEATPANLAAEKSAAEAAGVTYTPTTPWVCADNYEPVIADKVVYNNRFHFTQSFAVYLTGALEEALAPVMT